jgi:hypothetical protein
VTGAHRPPEPEWKRWALFAFAAALTLLMGGIGIWAWAAGDALVSVAGFSFMLVVARDELLRWRRQ